MKFMEKKSLVIGREFGSGGYDIAKRLADELGYKFFDKEIVELAAKRGNFNEKEVKKMDENAKGSFLYSIAMGNYSVGTLGGPVYYDLPINDRLFLAQSEIIKEHALEAPCIFVGRCADYVLRNAEIPHVSVFLYADMSYKVKRVAERLELSEQKAKDRIIKTEKQRRSYYDYYTNGSWGQMKTYDLCLNTAVLGEEMCRDLIKKALCE